MKLIIIPTLNEKKNIKKLFFQIKKYKSNFDILFIDDNSTDGTREEIINFNKKFGNVKYIFRPKKLGIGSAHKVGLIYGYKKKYKKIITMDADGTHDPKYIRELIKLSDQFDLIITNRFINPKSIKDWPLFRKILTLPDAVTIFWFSESSIVDASNFSSSQKPGLYKKTEKKIPKKNLKLFLIYPN